MSSATLSNPEDVACGLIASEKSYIRVIRCRTSEHRSRTRRVHIFLMPKAYTPMATTSRALEALYSEEPSAVKLNAPLLRELLSRRGSEFKEGNPGCIVFVNTLAEANELIGRLRSIIGSGVCIDGHSTDYDRDRAMKEDMFTRGEIDILVATRGLEVGVDYSRARIGIIYGMPFFLSDYTQRIGRIGRNVPSIIIDVFMPDKPIDHFYYTNWPLLCDNYLRSSHIQATEAYLINRSNPETVRRSGKRAVIDYLSLKSGHLMEQSLSNKAVSDEVERLINPKMVVSYVCSALKVHEGEELGILVQSVEELLDEIKRGMKEQARLEQVIGNIGGLTWLWSLRTAEKEVEYRFPLPRQQSRRRELSYAFRHCVPGQVISYREAFYVIDMVSAEQLHRGEES
jgi:CRISPR/Cas system-associated endonuclease/helicase Cas3